VNLPGAAPVTVNYLTAPQDRRAQMIQDVLHGLTAYNKHLPSKYFYDGRGSDLFEEITKLPEYYLTRAETEILQAHVDEIVTAAQPDEIVELGSGSSQKTRMLIEAMRRDAPGRRYVPIDISSDALEAAATGLCADYPWLEIDGHIGDFLADLGKLRRRGSRLIIFLGSTIGNYVPTLRYSLFRSVARALEDGDSFLLGIDLVKDEPTMRAAYDDTRGVSSEFNLNILRVVNDELGGDIPVAEFEHVTRFDPVFSCMSQSLRAKRLIEANIEALDLAVTFLEGEEIHTEVSCKFTRDQVEEEFASAGIGLGRWVTDDRERFALALGSLRAGGAGPV